MKFNPPQPLDGPRRRRGFWLEVLWYLFLAVMVGRGILLKRQAEEQRDSCRAELQEMRHAPK